MSVNPNMSKITFPSDHQYVIIDTSETPKYKEVSRLPMNFWIDYSRVNGNNSLDIPTLTLLINPSNMTLNFTKKINPVFARDGYVIEEWGEEQDVIQCSGKIGGYFVKKGSNISAPIKMDGLNRYHRSKSLSFKNIYKLLYIFRNNGAIFQNTAAPDNENKLIQSSGYPYINNRVPLVLENAKNRIDRVGDVYMSYDQSIYMGAFDNFSMKESADAPYTLEYSFQFTVQRRTEKDNRDFRYYSQVAFEGKDVSKNSKHVNTLIKTAIDVSANARVAEKAYLSEATRVEANTPIPSDENSSKVSPKKLAQSGVALMRSNTFNPTIEDRTKYEESLEIMNDGLKQNSYVLHESGKRNLEESIYDTIIREGNLKEGPARAKANNLAKQMSKDIPKPSSEFEQAVRDTNSKLN